VSRDDRSSGLPHLRIARPTDDLDALAAMYRDGLGLEELGGFRDHEGFDGVMLGHAGAGWHLEFTRRRGHAAGGAPSGEHLLVLYLPEREAWAAACARAAAAGFVTVAAENPYWERVGRTYRDRDGYRVVLQNAPWE